MTKYRVLIELAADSVPDAWYRSTGREFSFAPWDGNDGLQGSIQISNAESLAVYYYIDLNSVKGENE